MPSIPREVFAGLCAGIRRDIEPYRGAETVQDSDQVYAGFFAILFYPLMWVFSLEAVIRAEKDPVQRGYNWQILRWLFSAPLLLSDNIVVKARKTRRE